MRFSLNPSARSRVRPATAHLLAIALGFAVGSNTQIQYNNSGVFGGASGFVWNNVSNFLGLGTTTASAQFHMGSLHESALSVRHLEHWKNGSAG
jgi:hypothetical protein